MSDVSLLSGISGLSFDSTVPTPFLVFLPTPVAPSCLFSCQSHSPDFFPEDFFSVFCQEICFFCMTLVTHLGGVSQLVGGMYSMLLFGPGIHMAVFGCIQRHWGNAGNEEGVSDPTQKIKLKCETPVICLVPQQQFYYVFFLLAKLVLYLPFKDYVGHADIFTWPKEMCLI